MKYWTKPPEPGSLDEALSIAVLTWDESREYEYMQAIVTSGLAAGVSKESADALQKVMDSLQSKYFGDGGEIKIDEGEKEEFLKLMETHAVRVNVDGIQQAIGSKDAPIKGKQQFIPEPRGRFVDD